MRLLWPGNAGPWPRAGLAADCRLDGVAWIGRAADGADLVAAFDAVRALRAALRTGGGLDARRTVGWLVERAACAILVVAPHDGGVVLAGARLRRLYAPTAVGLLRGLVGDEHPLLTGQGGSLVLPTAPPALVADDGPEDLAGRALDDIAQRAAEVVWIAGSTAT